MFYGSTADHIDVITFKGMSSERADRVESPRERERETHTHLKRERAREIEIE